MSTDFLDDYGPKKKSKKAGAIDVPFTAVPDVEKKIDKATDSGKSKSHGRYKQLTFRLPPQHIDDLKEWADKFGVTIEDMKRWLVARGLQSLREGERPDADIVTTKVIKLP